MKSTLMAIMIVVAAAAVAIAGDHPKIEITTTRGNMVLDLATWYTPSFFI